MNMPEDVEAQKVLMQQLAQSLVYSREDSVRLHISDLLELMKKNKPNDRSDKDRYWQICITDIEKASAVFETFVCKE